MYKKKGQYAPNCLELRIAGSMKKINYIIEHLYKKNNYTHG